MPRNPADAERNGNAAEPASTRTNWRVGAVSREARDAAREAERELRARETEGRGRRTGGGGGPRAGGPGRPERAGTAARGCARPRRSSDRPVPMCRRRGTGPGRPTVPYGRPGAAPRRRRARAERLTGPGGGRTSRRPAHRLVTR
ncbi:hypothetical protein LT493_44555 [Streptomyces tricolor]|nr:hypothetical protein [Streptomyces tricolor]